MGGGRRSRRGDAARGASEGRRWTPAKTCRIALPSDPFREVNHATRESGRFLRVSIFLASFERDTATPIPLPAPLGFMLAGLGVCALMRRRRAV